MCMTFFWFALTIKFTDIPRSYYFSMNFIFAVLVGWEQFTVLLCEESLS